MEQVDTAKSTLLFLDTGQRRKERCRGKHTETQSPWMCFTKKRKLIGGKEAAWSKGDFLRDQEKIIDVGVADGIINTSNKGG